MASGPQRGSLGADTMGQLQKYGKSKDWWILGSTNYAVVDPRKPEGSGELAKKHFKPQKQAIGLSKLFPSGSVPGSTVVEALDDLFLRESLSRRFGRSTGSRDGNFSKIHKSTSSAWQRLNAATGTSSYSSYTTVTSGQAPGGRGRASRNSLLYSSGHTRSFASYRSGLLPLSSRSSAGPPTAKLPSLRTIFQRQQTGESRRRRLSFASPFLATSSKASFLRAPAGAPPFEQLPSRGCSRSYDPPSAKLQQGSMGGSPKDEGGGGLLRSLAKERLKKSFTRMQTASVSFMEADDEADTAQGAQTETADAEPLGAHKLALNALMLLERHARKLQTQQRNLRKAGQAVEGLAGLMRLESGGGAAPGEALSPLALGLNSPFGFDMLGLFDDSAHHGALERTESEGETAAAQKRRELLRCLKQLVANLQAASDIDAASREPGASEIGRALAAYEALSGAWDSRPPAFSLVLPAALASLACATRFNQHKLSSILSCLLGRGLLSLVLPFIPLMAYSMCAVACMEVGVQRLHSKLMRWGLEEGPEETAVNYLRYVTLHASLLDHQQLLNGLVARTLGLVLARERISPKGPPAPSSTQEEGETGTENKDSLGSPSSELEEIQSVVAAAQSAISAAHEAAGDDRRAVCLEADAEQASLANKTPSLHKLFFCVLELRLHVNKLLGLRLELSELGCTRSAWSELEAFKNNAQEYISSVDMQG
ncbi:hypothetical protein Esti_003032 [Eimeria stiedai]